MIIEYSSLSSIQHQVQVQTQKDFQKSKRQNQRLRPETNTQYMQKYPKIPEIK